MSVATVVAAVFMDRAPPPDNNNPTLHEYTGTAIEINGSIVQSNTHKNDAMLDISTKRSFQFIPPPFVVVAVDCGGASVFVVDMGSTDNGDSLLLLLYMLLGLTDVDFEINEFAKLVVLPNSLPCGL
jgi:hypothetical protein